MLLIFQEIIVLKVQMNNKETNHLINLEILFKNKIKKVITT